MSLSLLLLSLITTVVAQSTPAVVCVPGQCIQGFSNITIGGKLSASGAQTDLHLLPGEYSSATDPKLLNELLTSSSATFTPSAGFSRNNVAPLPLSLKLEPGLAIYSGSRYSGQAGFSALPSAPIVNATTPFTANSLALAENVWVAISSSTNSERIVLWESVPDVSQLNLPSTLNLHDIQSSTCAPACSSSGLCNASGQCVCPPNFSGTSCESCAAGFFGPRCEPCPEGCEDCDEGISGSGRCLSQPISPSDPRSCDCVNGECNPDGTCTCNDGWQDGVEGKCSQCTSGFFLSNSGDCSACDVGCRECSSGNAVCTQCRPGFTQDPNDRTKCNPVIQTDSTGAACGPNAFSDGQQCQLCDRSCGRCFGPSSTNCLTCAAGTFMFEGRCVSADSNGICAGSNGRIADALKGVCEACPSKCSSCSIPGFNGATPVSQVRCTQCLPGSVLHEGRCLDNCPAGTFVGADGFTCTACSSSCTTCSGSADFCTSCPGGAFASDGECVSTCPTGTFSTTSNSSPPVNSCSKCHPDCESCTGPSFTQCTACPASRPVLSAPSGSTSGRCLPSCGKSQYFDAATRQCRNCDGNCSSCTGPGPDRCLSCQSPRQVVRDGQCVDANCSNNSNVISGLGVCLSDIVQVPSKTDNEQPLPSITGISDPAPTGRVRLEWWQILLMALGCAFIFVMFLWCCRRRARKQRQKRTQMFAKGKGIVKTHGRWNWAARWKQIFRRRNRTPAESDLPIAYNHQDVAAREMGMDIKMVPLDKDVPKNTNTNVNIHLSVPNAKSRDDDFDSYIDAYDRRSSMRSHTPSVLPDIDGYYPSRSALANRDQLRKQATGNSGRGTPRDIERDSMYSEFTGEVRNTPEPRIPVKRDLIPLSNPTSRSSSPAPRPGVLRKPVPTLERKRSEDTIDSIVIAPPVHQLKQQEGVLVDLDAGSERGFGFGQQKLVQNQTGSTLPVQYQTPALQPQPTFASLTEAQAYAMAVKPQLGGASSQSAIPTNPGYTLAWVPTHMTGSSSATGSSGGMAGASAVPMPTFTTMGLPSAQTGNSIGSSGGNYWMQSSAVRPTATGSSSGSNEASKNPFRQAGL
ncbi:FRAS1 protein [Coprinopsis cinerea okayama7|uniref:FRAS1 protein n=1 Tax=Coprinopsis cinerea (strain Okayama-7 / 130 / ATCC MYA-4618 / FGSC 9003) TaxID=240176 RepID=A8P9S8_COPC7|nr:FRAS1 protein [Coprinopsis cinerea okayama7\|eukprot:XP_001839829.1 FRAS1 protein [Coprinopsis cinerea okayama7\